MRKSLLTLLVSLALCGAAMAAIIATNARAQGAHKPAMVAMVPGLQLAANDSAHGTMMRGGAMRMPPPAEMAARRKQMCREFYAHTAGGLAYTEAKLDLTAAQQPLFARWKTVKLDIAKRREGACDAGRRDAARPGPVDRMARREARLKRRLADLDNERPVLEAFYNALTPAQKTEFAIGGRAHGMGMMGQRRFAGGPRMMGRMMGSGPMGMDGARPPGAPPLPER
jgi:hypothetical protein